MQNDLDTLRMVRDNLKTLMPFVLVQGDAVHRVNPGSQQVVNANCAWAVSNGERSAHKVRALVDNLNNSYGALDALIARMEHAAETPAAGVDEKALRRLAEQHWEAHKALHATDADGGKCYRTEEDKREFIAAWTQTERRVFEAYERAKAEGGE